MKFVMNGNQSKTIHGAYSRTPLEISGHFYMSGPQPIEDGGAPQWVADLMDSNSAIQQVAVSTKEGGAVWTRMK